mmetsp:Transcript_15906/g.24759  ORF Transcript_15906/g.24759 Transcript_15906/m.24759 type:complete len:259 (+) Transcript_15906:1456-2232(+)
MMMMMMMMDVTVSIGIGIQMLRIMSSHEIMEHIIHIIMLCCCRMCRMMWMMIVVWIITSKILRGVQRCARSEQFAQDIARSPCRGNLYGHATTHVHGTQQILANFHDIIITAAAARIEIIPCRRRVVVIVVIVVVQYMEQGSGRSRRIVMRRVMQRRITAEPMPSRGRMVMSKSRMNDVITAIPARVRPMAKQSLHRSAGILLSGETQRCGPTVGARIDVCTVLHQEFDALRCVAVRGVVQRGPPALARANIHVDVVF